MSERLFDVADKQRRVLAGNLPELLGTTVCPDCQAATTDTEWTEQALFIFGGYGANRTSVLRHCVAFCGWGITLSVTETSPRR